MNPNHLAISRKTFLCICVFVALAIYIGFFAHRIPDSCQTERQHFKEGSYVVAVCYLYRDDSDMNRIALRVYDSGFLVAERKFSQETDPGGRRLNVFEYTDNEIVYSDADPQRIDVPKQHRLVMPPSKWDWFTANYLPF